MKQLVIIAIIIFGLFFPAPAVSNNGSVPPTPLKWKKSKASFYGKGSFKGYCGKRFRSERHLVVAHKSLPCNSTVLFKHRGKVFKAKVVDRGPNYPGRTFDVSYALAKRLKILNKGVGTVSWRR